MTKEEMTAKAIDLRIKADTLEAKAETEHRDNGHEGAFVTCMWPTCIDRRLDIGHAHLVIADIKRQVI